MSHFQLDHKLDEKFMLVIHFMVIYSEFYWRHEQLATKKTLKTDQQILITNENTIFLCFFVSSNTKYDDF